MLIRVKNLCFWKQFNILYVMYEDVAAWEHVEETTLQKEILTKFDKLAKSISSVQKT